MKYLTSEQIKRALMLVNMGISRENLMLVLAEYVTNLKELEEHEVKIYLDAFTKGFYVGHEIIEFVLNMKLEVRQCKEV